eukprot:COSAG05_NODE_105_length_18793_cov_115.346421_13_plen_141_part_00
MLQQDTTASKVGPGSFVAGDSILSFLQSPEGAGHISVLKHVVGGFQPELLCRAAGAAERHSGSGGVYTQIKEAFKGTNWMADAPADWKEMAEAKLPDVELADRPPSWFVQHGTPERRCQFATPSNDWLKPRQPCLYDCLK